MTAPEPPLPWPIETTGAPEAPPLLLLHGFMGSHADWAMVTPHLSELFCLLPDLPGHGQNLPPFTGAPLTFETLALQLEKLLEQLSLPRVHLLGYSMGGRLALYFAVNFPQRVAALILEGANPGLSRPAQRRARAAEDERRAAQLRAEGMAAFVDAWYQLPLFDSLRQQPTLLAKTVARRKKNNATWLAHVITQLSPGRQPALWTALPHLSLPVLLLAGAQDEKYRRLIEQAAALLPQATAHVVPHAGHNVHLEQPALFANLVRQFVTAHT